MHRSSATILAIALSAMLAMGAGAPRAEQAPKRPAKPADKHADEKPWTALFDGKTLDGWKNPYKYGKAEVKDGEIHLTSTRGKFFLVTENQYADFVFEAEVRLPEKGKANSGFMFRCHQKPNKVWGYQAEVDPTDRKWSGGLYDEGRRKWFISPNRDKAKSPAEGKKSIKEFRQRAGECYKHAQWNKYRIECRGDHIRISVNGVLTTDVRDPEDAQGYIALQHHGEKGQTYRFRNIRIQVLKEADPNIQPDKEEPKGPPRKRKKDQKTKKLSQNA